MLKSQVGCIMDQVIKHRAAAAALDKSTDLTLLIFFILRERANRLNKTEESLVHD